MADNNYNFLSVVAVALVVAVVVSLITASITGNIIKVKEKRRGAEVYTKQEMDIKFSDLKNSCQYFGMDEPDLVIGKKVSDICKKVDMKPIFIEYSEYRTIYGNSDCNFSQGAISTSATGILNTWRNDSKEDITLGPITNYEICNNFLYDHPLYDDINIKDGYSTGSIAYYSGVLCCKS